MINAGSNLLHGLWEGISGAASWLWEKVSGWASSLVSGIKDFFGIHSPSTVFAEIGGNMADGVGVGFTLSLIHICSAFNKLSTFFILLFLPYAAHFRNNVVRRLFIRRREPRARGHI